MSVASIVAVRNNMRNGQRRREQELDRVRKHKSNSSKINK